MDKILLNGQTTAVAAFKCFRSNSMILKTGLPWVCVLSPTLFTNSITSRTEGRKLYKYVDNVALAAHIPDTQALAQYQQDVQTLLQTFVESSLELNGSKTKEPWCGFAEKSTEPFHVLKIHGMCLDQVQS